MLKGITKFINMIFGLIGSLFGMKKKKPVVVTTTTPAPTMSAYELAEALNRVQVEATTTPAPVSPVKAPKKQKATKKTLKKKA